MAKRKYDVSVTVLTLVVTLAPVLGAMGDKVAVIYASLFAALLVLAYRFLKFKCMKVTKVSAMFLAVALYCYLQLFWVSDKGNQVHFASVFLLAAVLSIIANDIKSEEKEADFSEGMLSVIYVGSVLYAALAFLYQIFIESNFIFGKMDLGKGSSTATACIMLMGFVCAIKLFHGREKTAFYYPSLVFIGIVFLMTGSLIGYLALSLLLLFFAMETHRKKVEILGYLSVVGVLAVLNVLSATINVLTGGFDPKGAFRGLVSIAGIGKGGYEASVAILNSGYTEAPDTFLEFLEVFGALGVVITFLFIWGAYNSFSKRKDVLGCVLFLSVAAVLLTSANSFCYMMIIFAVLFSIREEVIDFKVKPYFNIPLVLLALFFGVLSLARVPFMVATDAADYEKFEKAASYYALGAKMEMFSSEGWEKAYECAKKAEEEGINTTAEQNEYVKNALKFNKKNYLFRERLADVYIKSGNFNEALKLWNGIILRYDREILYPRYTKSLCDMMEKGNVDLTTMESLYNTILEYANKATDPDIKLEVNNILTKSQEFYIEKREGRSEVYNEIFVEEYTEQDATEEEKTTEAV